MGSVPDPMPRRSSAELVYDTGAQPLPAGVRTAVSRGRKLLYAAAEAELMLQVAPEARPAHVRLAGQVMEGGMPVEGAAVRLRGGATAVERTTDDDGEFRVAGLPAGGYALDIDTPTRRLGVDRVDLA
jgi:hypothetical protein